jgi:hypothetical protein
MVVGICPLPWHMLCGQGVQKHPFITVLLQRPPRLAPGHTQKQTAMVKKGGSLSLRLLCAFVPTFFILLSLLR